MYSVWEPYIRLICEALDAVGVKRCGVDVNSARTSWFGRSLLGLLALQSNGFSRYDLMTWLDTANIWICRNSKKRSHTSKPGKDNTSQNWVPAPVAAWERTARNAGAGTAAGSTVDDWRTRLTAYTSECRKKAAQFDIPDDPDNESSDDTNTTGLGYGTADSSTDDTSTDESDEYTKIAEYYHRQADYANDLLKFIEELHTDLHIDEAAHSTEAAYTDKDTPNSKNTNEGNKSWTWNELANWCRKLIKRYLDGRDRHTWPENEQKFVEEIDTVIDRLGDLDGVDNEPSPDGFLRALELELTDSAHTQGRFGEGVLVGHIGLALGVELDMVIVCGMAEGMLTSGYRGGSVLTEQERSSIGDDMMLAGGHTDDDHRALLSVLASANRAVLSYPRGDLRRNMHNLANRWLLDVAEAKDEQGIRPKAANLVNTTGSWFREVPSFTTGVRDTAFPVNEQEYDMKALLTWREKRSHNQSDQRDNSQSDTPNNNQHDTPNNQHYQQSNSFDTDCLQPELQRGIELRLARKSRRFTRFDGNLSTSGRLDGAALPNPQKMVL